MWPFARKTEERVTGERNASAVDFSALSGLITPTAAGVSVTETNAVLLPAVYKCVSLNAEIISSLPLHVYAKRGDARVAYPTPTWITRPNNFQTMPEFLAMTQASLDLDGNAYWLRVSDDRGHLGALDVIPPSAVTPEKRTVDGSERLVYWVNTSKGRDVYAQNEVVHLRSLTLPGELKGFSPIAAARQTIGIGIAAEQFGANFFGGGATLSGVVEVPGQMTPEQTERLKDAFTKRHGGVSKSHAVGVLTGGAKWTPLSVKPEEAQFLESRKYTNEDVAQLFGYPAGFFSSEGVKGYVTALHAELRLWYVVGLLPRITRIERALTDLLPRPAYVKLETNAFLRMDPAQRTAFYQAAQQGEWMTRNEIRALEEMDPVEGGNEFLHSVQWQQDGSGSDTQMSFDDATSEVTQ